jgi:hypothetical protein
MTESSPAQADNGHQLEHAIEEILHTDILPGTEIMRDGKVFYSHTSDKIAISSGVRKIYYYYYYYLSSEC